MWRLHKAGFYLKILIQRRKTENDRVIFEEYLIYRGSFSIHASFRSLSVNCSLQCSFSPSSARYSGCIMSNFAQEAMSHGVCFSKA